MTNVGTGDATIGLDTDTSNEVVVRAYLFPHVYPFATNHGPYTADYTYLYLF